LAPVVDARALDVADDRRDRVELVPRVLDQRVGVGCQDHVRLQPLNRLEREALVGVDRLGPLAAQLVELRLRPRLHAVLHVRDLVHADGDDAEGERGVGARVVERDDALGRRVDRHGAEGLLDLDGEAGGLGRAGAGGGFVVAAGGERERGRGERNQDRLREH
jgi:hypothetical protein